MLLREMFSPMGGEKEAEQQVDWIGDLKFFIDNEDRLLKTEMFPAVKRQMQNVNDPNAYQIYITPIKKCLRAYRAKFNLDNLKTKFPKEDIINLAKQIAEEQKHHITNGDYDAHR